MDASEGSDPSDGSVVVAADPQAADRRGAPTPTTFWRLDAAQPARIRLQQVSPTDFKLLEGFRYDGRGGAWEVHPGDLPDTDLASIPRLLGWFANSYGRHTFAALLHDHLVRNGHRLDPEVPRHEADDVFLDALEDLGVPYLRSRIMWAAVVARTRWKKVSTSPAMVLWALAAVVGILVLVWSVVAGEPLVAMAAALAPVPFAALWGRRDFRAGVAGGYTLWFVGLPTLVNLVFYWAYAVVEQLVRLGRLLRPPVDLPHPTGPPSFKDR